MKVIPAFLLLWLLTAVQPLAAAVGSSNAAPSSVHSPQTAAPAKVGTMPVAPPRDNVKPVGLGAERVFDLSVSPFVCIPSEGDTWQMGYGLEVQLRTWQTENWGWAISAAIQSFAANSGGFPDQLNFVTASLDGDATAFAFGPSVIYRHREGERFFVLFDAGIRYVFVKPSVVADFAFTDHWGTLQQMDFPLEVDDRFMLQVGAAFGGEIKQDITWFAGLAYQLDVGGDDSSLLDYDIGSKLGGLLVRAGVNWTL
jgi:hypothetical protein